MNEDELVLKTQNKHVSKLCAVVIEGLNLYALYDAFKCNLITHFSFLHDAVYMY